MKKFQNLAGNRTQDDWVVDEQSTVVVEGAQLGI